jgi:hypothetical protein
MKVGLQLIKSRTKAHFESSQRILLDFDASPFDLERRIKLGAIINTKTSTLKTLETFYLTSSRNQASRPEAPRVEMGSYRQLGMSP